MPKYGFGRGIACFFRTIRQLCAAHPDHSPHPGPGLPDELFRHERQPRPRLYPLTGGFFPFCAPILGWLGVFLTGSDTSSCALFGGMQRDTAIAVGMSPELAVASNASGGTTAKMISPQSLSVATAATGMVGEEGNLFRFTILHSIGMTLLLCILTWLQAGPLPGQLEHCRNKIRQSSKRGFC